MYHYNQTQANPQYVNTDREVEDLKYIDSLTRENYNAWYVD